MPGRVWFQTGVRSRQVEVSSKVSGKGPSRFPDSAGDAHARRLSDPARLASLRRTGLMDSAPEESFDRAARLASTVLGAPVSLVSLVDDARQFFKAQVGLGGWAAEDRETGLTHSFCQYVTTEDRALAVEDARTHPLLAGNGAIRDLSVIAYLGVPVRGPDGTPLGSLCAIHDVPHAWTDREEAVLADIAAMLETEIAIRAETGEKQLLFSEMAHRVGNLFAVVSGMISMTARSAETVPGFAEALSGRLMGLQRAHDLVRPLSPSQEAVPVPLRSIVARLLDPHLSRGPEQVSLSGPDLVLGPQAVTHLALIVHELATNSAKYGALSAVTGHVAIAVSEEEGTVVLSWAETGGPAITSPPERRGFGTQLVETTAAGALGGGIETDWRAGGAVHRLTMERAALAP